LTRSSMENYRFVISPRRTDDPRSAVYLADAHALGLDAVTRLRCHDLYFIEGQLSQADLERLAVELLSDPVTQRYTFTRLTSQAVLPPASGVVEVALRPGVTDPVAEQIVRGARLLGIAGVARASTGLRFEIDVDIPVLHLMAKRLLANAVIQRYAIGEIEPVFPHPAEASGHTATLPVCGVDDAGLQALSRARRAALDLAEMQAIQAYFRTEEREPTDVEIETIAQTWSEHCVHKTFKAKVSITPRPQFPDDSSSRRGRGGSSEDRLTGGGEINGLLKSYIRAATEQIAAPWVRSAFVDNAGIIDFDDTYEVSFKVETHNHPSAIEPFGGANTGVGGVIRDVLGVSAKPIANTDVLCFGPQDANVGSLPEGVLHPRRIQSGVVAGVQDYGNKIGIPTVNGAIWYDEGYTANPLVFCGCVGIAPKGSHPRQPQPGDRVIVLGGGTGRDGLRGATFSSMTMDAQTGEVSGASVQIGDPITEKGLIEVLLRARDQRLYHAVTDCGAGGLSSAVGEMSSTIGADVELKKVRLKYAGLAPWEIWLSEAQERMVFAVPPENLPALQTICDTFEVHLTDIGEFTGSGRLVVRYGGNTVLDLENRFLHEGIPQRHLKAKINHEEENKHDRGESGEEEEKINHEDREGTQRSVEQKSPCPSDSVVDTLNETLLALLAHPNIASKSAVIRIYDHEVQGGTVIKPLTGAANDGPSDACVLKPTGTRGTGGIVLSNGFNPEYGKLDAYHMAWSAIDEAIRNAVAVGCDPHKIALLDNFCWGDPLRPETLGSLVEACRGCHDAALHNRAPFISGKDSLNNEYLGSDGQRHAIPPTLLISAIGLIADVSQAVTMDLKEAGDLVYLAGEFQPALGGSHFAMLRIGSNTDRSIPAIPAAAPDNYRGVHAAIQAGLVRACHDLSEGGLAVAAAEMCIGGRLGLEIDGVFRVYGSEGTKSRFVPAKAQIPDDLTLALFGETNGCLLVEVHPSDREAFEGMLAGLPICPVGRVAADPFLSIVSGDEAFVRLPVEALVRAWEPG
jgi:phosphoribosylformylglycinamidine (FGAM) synthase-like enzyme/phosphoribosylformylglycinamidine (FGAM) synthase PurS component